MLKGTKLGRRSACIPLAWRDVKTPKLKDAGGDQTTHKVSVKAVRHTKRHREIEGTC